MFENHFRKLVHSRLRKLHHGCVTVREGNDTQTFGDANAPLQVDVVIENPSFYRQMVTGGGLGAAESLAQGDWSCSDLTSLVRILVRNLPLQASVVYLEAVDLLHDRLVVGQQISGLVRQAIDFGLGRLGLGGALNADIENLVNGCGLGGSCGTQGAASDTGREQKRFESVHCHWIDTSSQWAVGTSGRNDQSV